MLVFTVSQQLYAVVFHGVICLHTEIGHQLHIISMFENVHLLELYANTSHLSIGLYSHDAFAIYTVYQWYNCLNS